MLDRYGDTMQPRPRGVGLRASALGVTAALAVLGTAELGALLIGPESSPLFAVGSLAIDLAPFWLKEAMIGLFGTGDKVALFVILGLVLLVLAVVAGIAELRRRMLGILMLGIVALVARVAILTRPADSVLWAIPRLLGGAFCVLDRYGDTMQPRPRSPPSVRPRYLMWAISARLKWRRSPA